ncbi:hypothetical protein BYT27DRAFT_7186431 [Phlegmacium glaucopus]|nr:hypothetical protein BYT27DRAFT_7186431 [Phlegmacium glaucopus]
MDLLTNSIAPGAFHNSYERYDPPKCHSSTRLAVLEHIISWINNLQKLFLFMWLYGPAGAGKSAIAQSIAELCHKSNLLAASFFFSRTAVDRSDESRLIPTLVYQLCLSMPAIRKYVEDAIERDPLVLSRSLEAQINSLMVGPLRCALMDDKDAMSLRSSPKVIIIDGLDECGTAKVQRYILSVLATAVQEIHLPISFLIASRPEQMIRDAFRVEPLVSMTRQLALDDSCCPNNDIKLFFQSKFDNIKRNHPLHDLLPPDWPSDSVLDCLVQKSCGQFGYASTVMKYVDSHHHWPPDQLNIIFGLSNPGVETPFTELDALYIHIFSTVKNIDKALEILSLLVLKQTDMELTPQLLEDLFFLRRGDVYIILSDLHSIVDVPAPADRASSVIRIFYASLGDFLLDKSRSAKLFIDAGNAHANLTRYFIKHLSKIDLPTSKDVTHESFAHAFTMHCPLSSPMPELLDDLDDFDFYRFLTTFGSLGMVKKHLSYVFDWLKGLSQNHPSQKNLYSQNLLSLDMYLRSGLALLTSSSSLAQLVVTGVMLPRFHHYYLSATVYLGADLDQESFNTFQRASFPIICPYDLDNTYLGVEEMAAYYGLLSEFLDDPLRSKEFYIDGNKYADLAMAFAKNLFSPPMPSDTASEDSPVQDAFSAYYFSCLSFCLLKASPSKSLAMFLQDHEIPSYVQYYGHSLEAIVEAIENYTLRCNISKVPNKNIIINQSDQMDGHNCIAQIVSTDDPKSNYYNPTIQVRNSPIVGL